MFSPDPRGFFERFSLVGLLWARQDLNLQPTDYKSVSTAINYKAKQATSGIWCASGARHIRLQAGLLRFRSKAAFGL